MLKNYFRVAIRNLLKYKGYAFINIAGLAIGIACCLLIVMFVFYELSYDTFHSKADRIFRVTQTSFSAVKEEAGASTPFKVGPTLAAEYPQLIEKTVRFFDRQEPAQTLLNREEDKSFLEYNFYFADSTVFDAIDIELIRGNPGEALNKPLTMVLTEEVAERYFGDEDPMGKTLNYEGIRTMTVTGIMKPLPANSHMKIDILASFASLESIYEAQEYDENWFWNPCWTYVLLRKGVSKQELLDQLPLYVEKYYYPNRTGGEKIKLGLQSITDIHLYSDLDLEMNPNGSIFYVYLFSAVAVLILVIACINFMNLSTARSTGRSREVGMRKVLGANRGQLIKQFMGESFLMSFLGVALAMILVQLMLPVFNDFVGRQLVFNPLQNGIILFGLLILFIVVGLFSGIYPALYLSGFQPVGILQGKMGRRQQGASLRKGLVVFQFTLSVMLIIGTVAIYLQLRHMKNKRLGFEKERVVVMPLNQNLIAWYFHKFKERALEEPGITQVAGIGKLLGSEKQHYYRFAPEGIAQDKESSYMGLFVTYDFIDAYDIELIAGRRFSKEYTTDPEDAILINEKMVEHLNFDHPRDALGQRFFQRIINYSESVEEVEYFTVVGVVKDFHYTSVKKEISPLIIRLVDGERPIVKRIDYAAVKVAPGNIQKALAHLESVWKEINFVDPFTYHFHDEELEKIYASEARMGKIASAFSILCILVACLGLFGLASFTILLRTKEIGIRKTLGASIGNIVTLLSKEYMKLVLIANIVAWPVIYYLVAAWLQNFPYRIGLGWNMVFVFAAATIASMLICLFTISFQSIKVALINPVESIRNE